MKDLGYVTHQTLYGHAKYILDSLAHARKDRDRPLIFVAHALGGILVKSALIFSRQAQLASDENDSWATIFLATAGIVFFGTPQNDLADIVPDFVGRKPNNIPLSILELEANLDRFKAFGDTIPQFFFYQTPSGTRPSTVSFSEG